MSCLFLEVEPTALEFFLLEEEINSKMIKKLNLLSAPDIWIHYSEDPEAKIPQIQSGVFNLGLIKTQSLMLGEAIPDATYRAVFNEKNNSILVNIGGKVWCRNYYYPDEESADTFIFTKLNEAYVSVITMSNHKQKKITKPRDKYGMKTPLEALAHSRVYDDAAYKIRFKTVLEDGVYLNGEISHDYC